MKLNQNINSSRLSSYIADCMENKKAEDIRIIDLKKIKNSVTDYFVIATGNSNTHVDSIADGIEADVYKKYKERPWKKEGKDNSEWVLIDFVNFYLVVILVICFFCVVKSITINTMYHNNKLILILL